LPYFAAVALSGSELASAPIPSATPAVVLQEASIRKRSIEAVKCDMGGGSIRFGGLDQAELVLDGLYCSHLFMLAPAG